MSDPHDKHPRRRKKDAHDKKHAHTTQQGSGNTSSGYPGSTTHGSAMHGSNATSAISLTKNRSAISTSISMHEHPGTHNMMNKAHQTHLNSIKGYGRGKQMGNAQIGKGKEERGRG